MLIFLIIKIIKIKKYIILDVSLISINKKINIFVLGLGKYPKLSNYKIKLVI
jgi:hypothetical protein